VEHIHGSRSKTTGNVPEEKEAILGNMAHYYDRLSFFWFQGREKEIRRMTVEMAGIKPGDNVLEIGCGTGSLTLVAKAQAGQGNVCGIDAAPEMVEVARGKAARTGTSIEFKQGFLQEIPYPDRSFDQVLCSFMIFHTSQGVRVKGFTEIARVLKPGGRVFILDTSTPTRPWVKRIVKLLMGRMVSHSLSELLPVLQSSGFKDIQVGPTRFRILAFAAGVKPAI
jgi:ubiquinone/menaquinone biosynthesis C-methylase UbiE